MDHINTLFNGVLKNTEHFDVNFYGNIQSDDSDNTSLVTQNKKEYKKSQKFQLAELVVPDKVYKFINI